MTYLIIALQIFCWSQGNKDYCFYVRCVLEESTISDIIRLQDYTTMYRYNMRHVEQLEYWVENRVSKVDTMRVVG